MTTVNMYSGRWTRRARNWPARVVYILSLAMLPVLARHAGAAQIDIAGPAGSGAFGTTVTVLANGNFVVTDPNGPVANVGAVYLYGPSGALISFFTGSSTNDHVGSGGVALLANGNFVVVSPQWSNDIASTAGAVTWVNGTTGLSGVVSSSNSLVGTSSNDQVGYTTGGNAYISVITLYNGDYAVCSPYWNNAAASSAGAVTRANGSTGISGAVSVTNSLVGTHANDQVCGGGYAILANNNFIIASPSWNKGLLTHVGAVTWINGSSGLVGAVSPSNSLIGTSSNDQVGASGINFVGDNNYVVVSSNWSNGAASVGAVTWANGNTGISGVISPANSLVGSSANDQVGSGFGDFGLVFVLGNGNYLVSSPHWSNAGATSAGAFTWANGNSGVSGVVSSGNSLVGSSAQDHVGNDGFGLVELNNDNYTVASPLWNNTTTGASSAGAVTWGSGSAGVSGVVSATNSLVGTTAGDQVGSPGGAIALGNGNYVVPAMHWHNGGIAEAGAATWANGTTGLTGAVSAANSLVGSSVNDAIGSLGINPLSNGNYVVISPNWSNAAQTKVGAVTWANGATGLSGAVALDNSLVGSQANDEVGLYGVATLTNGNYVVKSAQWANGVAAAAGATTWGNGASGLIGAVSTSNSLVGTTANDRVGEGIKPLYNGNYVVLSPLWSNGAATAAGAATWGDDSKPLVDTVSVVNSLVGSSSNDNIGTAITALGNGNYLTVSANWNNPATGASKAGAVTWANGKGGISGAVSPANSLVGVSSNDQLGGNYLDISGLFYHKGIERLFFGSSDYAVVSAHWSNGAAVNAGATTLARGNFPLTGTVQGYNSVRGTVANAAQQQVRDYDPAREHMVVGRPAENIVSIFIPEQIFASGFE